MRDEEIKLNPFKDIDDPISIPRVSKTPLDSLDSTLDTFNTAITNPLFEFDSEFTSILDNLIFDIQNENSDESKMETIMDEVQGIENKAKTVWRLAADQSERDTWLKCVIRGTRFAELSKAQYEVLEGDVTANDWLKSYDIAGKSVCT
ncbi:hypothetical protein Tco_1089123 [Tanacetum coccineum]